ncbi:MULTISPECIES: hypothetical protein [Planktothrix]|jgi:heat shock protein HtpX|uniref:HtpX-2 peptidase n=2 Tax=Planktothrix TaxID=54304 RepID=A0A4P5ZJE6_PLAAG|nr:MULTISPECIES: hypothetical protein [Planktothrix]CAD5920044.1 hypothetical protein NO108_00979 [Planktothrix rubescens]CAC5340107.1 hypothetical protein PLAN_100157 [Planktothrix rubescens NIVA-CYA 18]CAD5947168.1 hypothetical protein PCC7821_02290 [Planktothrix rubescens NIVA-CYA 18]CAH2572836.1 hypothetical protein PRNO82_02245 [Planktothrix rubescens]GDZ96268.1 HtpX-2 peptidase [Planktothrix agardhii CCAP 1459/11A]
MESPCVHAGADVKNSFSGQTMASLFSTHPPTEARIQALLKLDQQMS